MLRWLGIGSADKAVDNVLDKENGLLTQVGGWIGNMDYTDEERAEAHAKMTGVVIDYAKSTVDEDSQRSKARREIARMWMKLQIYLIALTAITIPVDHIMDWTGDNSLSDKYFTLATATVMIATTSAIVLFYFGSYGWQKVQETRNKK